MSDENRRVFPAICVLHRGSIGFTNLVVCTLDVTVACVITLDEAAATELFDVLGEWLG